MLDITTAPETLFQAEAAYRARTTPNAKRYRVEDITCHAVGIHDQSRSEIEAFIAEVFATSYGATITQFMPTLVALRDQNGVLMAAFGLSNAAEETLFLEQYFDGPIETLLEQRLGLNLIRSDITCIGNLAVANPRNANVLIAHVIQHSLDIGVQWAVATAHHSLQNGLIKGGRDVHALCQANKDALPLTEQLVWGSYYNKTPQVVAIRGVSTAEVTQPL